MPSIVLVPGRTKPALPASSEAVKTEGDKAFEKSVCCLLLMKDPGGRGSGEGRQRVEGEAYHLETSLGDPSLPVHLCLSVPAGKEQELGSVASWLLHTQPDSGPGFV